VTFVVALQRLNNTFGSIAASLGLLNTNSALLELLNKLLEPADKQFRRRGGIKFKSLQQAISLRNLTLQYSPELQPALRNLNLDLPRGSTVALVGSSGAGKSSIADLLVGLYDASEGQILIDGTPLPDFDLISWQQHLGVVSQDTFLFNATIAENISHGSPNSSRAEIVAAAEKAQAHGFISDLSDGYDTLIRADCPSPFELFPTDAFAATRNQQAHMPAHGGGNDNFASLDWDTDGLLKARYGGTALFMQLASA
jgi:ATP-binding cassette subfamily B protein/subfamily B ATP-binding cassette protein MsbA